MHSTDNSETEIRKLLTRWEDAFRRKDLDAVMSVYASEEVVVAFDVVPPLALRGSAAYRRSYEEFFAMFSGPLRIELRDIRIVAGEDVAFLHCFDQIGGQLHSGEQFSLWVRVTSGLQKLNGEWRIIHDHVSVPTNFETGAAVLDGEP